MLLIPCLGDASGVAIGVDVLKPESRFLDSGFEVITTMQPGLQEMREAGISEAVLTVNHNGSLAGTKEE